MGMSYRRHAAGSLAAGVVLAGVITPAAPGQTSLGRQDSIECFKAPRPGNASIALGGVQSLKSPASSAALGAGVPKLRIKSGRVAGVAVMYGIKRIGKTRNYRLVVMALRRPGSTGTAAVSKLTLETVPSAGVAATVRKTETIENVIGPNRSPASPSALNMQGFTFSLIGGTLPKIGTQQYIARNVAAEALNRNSRPGRTKFTAGIEDEDAWGPG
jgi:hypothetical protein